MIGHMRFVLLALSSLAIALLLAGFWMLFNEDRYIFFPDRQIAITPAQLGLAYQELQLRTDDGIRLQAWWIPAPHAVATLLHFHGNAGNIGHRLPLYREWQRLGLNVLAVEYRGYGNSEGTPSEPGLYRDAEAAWRYLTGVRHIPPDRIIIAGRSLGAAVACHLARGKEPAGVALETPFTSIPDMARYHYPWLPVWPLIRNRFAAVDMVRDVRAPLLVIGATDDGIAPPTMTEQVFGAASQPKQWVELRGGHNDFDEQSHAEWQAAWRQWLASLPAPEAGAGQGS